MAKKKNFLILFSLSLFCFSFQIEATSKKQLAIFPQTDEQLISLAQQLFIPKNTSFPISTENKHTRNSCGLHDHRILQAALQSPKFTFETKRKIALMKKKYKPILPEYYSYGNFEFFYTTNDFLPLHNVPEKIIQNLAINMQYAYDILLANFYKISTDPYNKIQVEVYYLPNASGVTFSENYKIKLNSEDMFNECYSKTIPAHELFHRVQFTYGLDQDGYEDHQSYWVEGTANWAMLYCYPELHDYIYDVNDGLSNPNIHLWKKRSYDAVHLWVYFCERYLESYSTQNPSTIINYLLTSFQKGYRAKKLIKQVTVNFFNQQAFSFLQDWHETNYLKNTKTSEKYTYNDNGQTFFECDEQYAYRDVSLESLTVITNNQFTWQSKNFEVKRGGALYHTFLIAENVTSFRIKLKSEIDNKLYYSLIGLKNKTINDIVQEEPIYFFRDNNSKLNKKFDLVAGEYDKFILIVSSRMKKSSYRLQIK